MGYYAETEHLDITIPADKVAAALAAIKALDPESPATPGGGGTYYPDGRTVRHFSWVSTEEYRNAESLEQAFKAWGFDASTLDDGAVTIHYREGEKLGDEEILFKTLAPFIADGGAIEWRGEDGAQWRWLFDKGQMTEQTGRTVWE